MLLALAAVSIAHAEAVAEDRARGVPSSVSRAIASRSPEIAAAGGRALPVTAASKGRAKEKSMSNQDIWRKVAAIRVPSGKLGIASGLGPLDQGPYVCAPGVYGVYARTEKVGGAVYVAGARIANRTDCARGKPSRSVAIDHGRLGVFDFARAEKVIEGMPEDEADRISEEVWAVEGTGTVAWGRKPGELTMAVMSTGDGDGIYPVFELVHRGVACGYEVVFLEDEDLE